jgi:hypothetical protein
MNNDENRIMGVGLVKIHKKSRFFSDFCDFWSYELNVPGKMSKKGSKIVIFYEK